MILIELDDILRIHGRKMRKPPIDYRLSPEELREYNAGLSRWIEKMRHDDRFEEYEKVFAAEEFHEEQWIRENPDKQVYPGPYLLRITDQAAWLSRDGVKWDEAVPNTVYQSPDRMIWSGYCDLYADAVGVSHLTLKRRLDAILKRVHRMPDRWQDWGDVYTWIENPDLMWDCFYRHTRIQTREVEDKKEIRYVSR